MNSSKFISKTIQFRNDQSYSSDGLSVSLLDSSCVDKLHVHDETESMSVSDLQKESSPGPPWVGVMDLDWIAKNVDLTYSPNQVSDFNDQLHHMLSSSGISDPFRMEQVNSLASLVCKLHSEHKKKKTILIPKKKKN